MDNDDRLVGRVLSRREALAVMGAMGAAALAACAPNVLATTQAPASTTTPAGSTASATTAATTVSAGSLPSCIVRPALTEGPYFVDEKINRSDIRSDPSDGSVKDGTPLQITMNVSQITGSACAALAGATVDVWHCDATGVYSDASDPSFNTQGKKFLRGNQTTDANGQVKFTTIYPGWYRGRAVHIHFKIRTTSGHDFTSQWFFADSQSDAVFAQAPYASRGARYKRNSDDGIYNGGGDQLLLTLSPASQGFATTFNIGLQFA